MSHTQAINGGGKPFSTHTSDQQPKVAYQGHTVKHHKHGDETKVLALIAIVASLVFLITPALLFDKVATFHGSKALAYVFGIPGGLIIGFSAGHLFCG